MSDPQARTLPGALSPPSIAHFTSADVDQVRHLLNRFFYSIAVGVPDGADSFKLGAEVIRLGPLTIGRFTFGTQTTLTASELDAYHVTIPTSGHMHSRHAGHDVEASPETAAVFGPGHPVYTRHDADSAELDVKIERPALEAELSAMLGHPIEGPLDLPPAIDVSDGVGRNWRRIVQVMHDESNHPDSLIHRPIIGERARHLILTGLLFTIPHRYRDELTEQPRHGAPKAIRRVQDTIESEPELPFTVTDLAAVANISVRSLQEGFRRHLGCAPMTYLQRVRLERAHRDLRTADPTRETVSAVAHRWGFAHLGRFASAYRSHFEQSPSETLRTPG